MIENATPQDKIVRALLRWYDRHKRVLPWRSPRGQKPDPYRVWLSEIMLQQTNVAKVRPYFEHFLSRWPNVASLARADLEEVLHAWQGLGYYARARHLLACAQAVCAHHGGVFPERYEELRSLPGIGSYTAGAICAIAYGQSRVAIDANVERVLARLFRCESRAGIEAWADRVMDTKRPGDLLQAMMDLGASLCQARTTDCDDCPLQKHCMAYAEGEVRAYPRKKPRQPRPERHGIAFWMQDPHGRVALRRRPPKGLLGGLMEVPGTPWRAHAYTEEEMAAQAPLQASWSRIEGRATHVFTHFALHTTIYACRVPRVLPGYEWVSMDELSAHALSSLTKKIIARVRAAFP
ncbi:MAG TPA: A/G-specific adenine glycosylase [Dongiaceae bacterium]|jgi:A/G-specific adenine glycosylase|nr:A/G-specific adenine glycosylase [Dongiaceae bacterium]